MSTASHLLRLDPQFNWVQIGKSNIHGLGLFSRRRLVTNEPLGLAMLPKRLAREELLPHLIEGYGQQDLDPWFRVIGARFINHSSSGNLRAIYHKQQVIMFARRDIQIGEELSTDYSLIYPLINLELPEFCLATPSQKLGA